MKTYVRLCTLLVLPLVLAACGGGKGGGETSASTTVTNPSTTPTTPAASGLGAISSAVAGFNQTAVLRAPAASASGLIWGDNSWGQIGDGTLTSPRPSPLEISGSTTSWKSVAIGKSHTLGIKSDGTLWAWGLNLNGQIGDGTSGTGRYRASPVQIGTAKDWIAVAAGEAHSVAIQGTATSNKLVAWGQNAYFQLGLSTTLAGSVLVDTRDASVPAQITKLSDSGVLISLPVTGKPWRAITAGYRHNVALRSDGQIFTWGDNTFSQLGQSAVVNQAIPTNIDALTGGTNALAVASGANHSLAIQTDHSLWAWGDNTYGQLGVGSGTASSAVGIKVGLTSDWFTVAAGGRHTLAIKLDRTLWAWGSNEFGQLGDGTTDDSLTPIQVGTSANWIAVSAGKDHSLAIDTDGKLWIWGRNSEGQLGSGATSEPVLVPTLLP